MRAQPTSCETTPRERGLVVDTLSHVQVALSRLRRMSWRRQVRLTPDQLGRESCAIPPVLWTCGLHKRLHTHCTLEIVQVPSTEKRRYAALFQSPLPDSNRRPPLYEEGPCVNWVGCACSVRAGVAVGRGEL